MEYDGPLIGGKGGVLCFFCVFDCYLLCVENATTVHVNLPMIHGHTKDNNSQALHFWPLTPWRIRSTVHHIFRRPHEQNHKELYGRLRRR
jgi:hypothetical protein